MIVRPLEKKDIGEAVRILLLSFDREISVIFRDIYFAGEILKEFFNRNLENCFVAEKGRILGFSCISFKKHKIFKFLRERMGFIEGLRASLLLRFFLRDPQKDEAFLDFIAVSPLRRREGIGSAIMEKLIEVSKEKNVRSLNCIIHADSDLVLFFKKFDFEIVKMFESRLAEKYFSSRVWFLMSKYISSK
ncbi:MAG: GNAT family N-acetyltransferase [Archaeoglobaceae archaeon]|nr:GNAT family N-acetyltransferase [Archaeoglobaceae archaeon]MDW7989978.1 GNAT family N-acetyltransferase [Archaeoglobaceae archaeon]